MSKKKKSSKSDETKQLDEIKRLVIIAMFSVDMLIDRLVLKGGNAIDLIHHITTRSSRDVDFSIQGEFAKEEMAEIKDRIETSLKQTLGESGLEVFDIKMEEVPKGLTADVADFWGGYDLEFKVIERARLLELGNDLETIRKYALKLGAGDSTKFSIDISKYEYIVGKIPEELSGYRIFVYTPAMIVCEKLRAICQQMPEYGPVVKRNRAGSARARDFLDIYTLVTELNVTVTSKENQELLYQIFAAKRVPLSLLKLIAKYREFHGENFLAVKDTVKPGFALQSFDFYFDFTLELVSKHGLTEE